MTADGFISLNYLNNYPIFGIITRNMSKIRTETEILIGRNLFLPKSEKDQILASNEKKQFEILPMLREMDKKQTILIKKVLKVEPDFFEELDRMAVEERDRRNSLK